MEKSQAVLNNAQNDVNLDRDLKNNIGKGDSSSNMKNNEENEKNNNILIEEEIVRKTDNPYEIPEDF